MWSLQQTLQPISRIEKNQVHEQIFDKHMTQISTKFTTVLLTVVSDNKNNCAKNIEYMKQVPQRKPILESKAAFLPCKQQ